MKIALLTHAGTQKAAAVAQALAQAGVSVDLLVFEAKRVPSARARLTKLIYEKGLGGVVLSRFATPGPSAMPSPAGNKTSSLPNAAAYAAQHGIKVLPLADLTSPASLAALQAENIDLMIHSGAGILRAGLLAIPRIGVLNAHMGVLPQYRGMNVAEWSALCGGPVGCTVHFIDPGIDTGRIIRVEEVSMAGINTIAALRAAVDQTQLLALAQVTAQIVASGQAPASTSQTPQDGRQYFTMHPLLLKMLATRLAENRSSSLLKNRSAAVANSPRPGGERVG